MHERLFEPNRLYTVKEVATVLEISVDTTYREFEHAAGTIVRKMKVKRMFRIPGWVANAWVARNSIAA